MRKQNSMIVGITILPALSSPSQSVELQNCRCRCYCYDKKQYGSIIEDPTCEHGCIYSCATKVQTSEQAVQTCSLSSQFQSIKLTPPPTVLYDRVNGEEQKEYYRRGGDDHPFLSISSSFQLSLSSATPSYEKCVQFNLESSEVIPYLHYRHMTDEEIDASWFTYDEKKQFRREVNMTKRLIQHQQTIQYGSKLDIINKKSRDGNPYSNNDELSLSLSLSSSLLHSDEDGENEVLELCQRGLEGRQQRLIGMSRYVVFEEQERQYAILRQQRRRCLRETSNTTNFAQKKQIIIQRGQQIIATRYRSITEDAIILARQRARQDSNEVIVTNARFTTHEVKKPTDTTPAIIKRHVRQ